MPDISDSQMDMINPEFHPYYINALRSGGTIKPYVSGYKWIACRTKRVGVRDTEGLSPAAGDLSDTRTNNTVVHYVPCTTRQQQHGKAAATSGCRHGIFLRFSHFLQFIYPWPDMHAGLLLARFGIARLGRISSIRRKGASRAQQRSRAAKRKR